jgi:hypothetical protein
MLPLIVMATVDIWLPGTKLAAAQDQISQDFENCRIIADDRSRLDCFKKLLPKADAATTDGAASDWQLVRGPGPNGGSEAFAVVRPADISKSDADLAGLMIRCQEKPGFEVAVALVRPFPPRTKRDVIIESGTTQSVLHAEIAPPGTMLVLPIDATAFTTGPWRELKELDLKVNDPEGEIRGVIQLDGIASAIAKLSASCPSK